MERNSPAVKSGLHVVTLFQRVKYGQEVKKRKSNFIIEKSYKHYFLQVIQINIDGAPGWLSQ